MGVDEGLEIFFLEEAMRVEALQQLFVFAYKINELSALSHHFCPCCFVTDALQLLLGDFKGVDEGEGKGLVEQPAQRNEILYATHSIFLYQCAPELNP